MKKTNDMKRLPWIAVFAILTSNSQAIDYDYSLFSTLRHSDNLAQDADGTTGNALNTGVTFGVSTDTNTSWQIELDGVLAREEFSIDELQGQDNKRLSGTLTFNSPSTNLNLLVREELSQIPRNRFSTQEVGNISDVNVLLVRPSYFYRVTPIDRLVFESTYTRTDTSTDDLQEGDAELFDTVINRSSVSYERQLNATSEASLVFSKINTEFNNETGISTVDYEQDDVYLRWVGLGRFNQLQVEVGRSRLVDDLSNDFETNYNYALYTRQINRTHNLELTYRDGFFVNFSQNFTDDTLDIDDQGGNFGSAQEFVQQSITYTIDDDALTSEINFFDAEFESTLGNSTETRNGFDLTFTYSLQHLFNTSFDSEIAISYQDSTNEFLTENTFIKNTVESFTAQYNYTFSSEINFFVELTTRKTDDETGNSPFFRTDANSVTLGFNYQPVSREARRR